MKSVYLERQHSTQTSNFNSNLVPMNTFTSTRSQLIADILDSHLSFDAVRATTEWDELTCLEQMTLEDLMDM